MPANDNISWHHRRYNADPKGCLLYNRLDFPFPFGCLSALFSVEIEGNLGFGFG